LSRLQQTVDLWQQGRWVIQAEIGRGASGIVYLATDRRLGQAALKFSCDEQRTLMREVAVMQRIAHPHVCTVHESNSFGSQLFGICLELLDAGSLEELANVLPAGQLPLSEVTRVGVHILQALQHMHEKSVLHRDIKPSK
jgi:serine/threonine protein kinase